MGAENIQLGPCRVTYNGTDLGLTKGGVSLEVSTEVYDVTVDQFGESEVSSNIISRNVMVSVPMAEPTLENLTLSMPGSSLVVDGVDSNKKYVKVNSGIGVNMLNVTYPLKLHPIAQGSSTAFDINIPLAAPNGAISFSYEANQERIFNVEFKGYVNTDLLDADYDLLLTYGDTTATP